MGFFVRGPATAGLPGRDAATTGLDGIFCTGSGHRGTRNNLVSVHAIMSVRAVCMCLSSAPRADLSRLSKHKRKGFLWYLAALYWGARETH